MIGSTSTAARQGSGLSALTLPTGPSLELPTTRTRVGTAAKVLPAPRRTQLSDAVIRASTALRSRGNSAGRCSGLDDRKASTVTAKDLDAARARMRHAR